MNSKKMFRNALFHLTFSVLCEFVKRGVFRSHIHTKLLLFDILIGLSISSIYIDLATYAVARKHTLTARSTYSERMKYIAHVLGV